MTETQIHEIAEYVKEIGKLKTQRDAALAIAEQYKQVWLPCDQTLQCANTEHSEECPVGWMQADKRKAVKEEREACAKIAERMAFIMGSGTVHPADTNSMARTAQAIAESIRKRGEK